MGFKIKNCRFCWARIDLAIVSAACGRVQFIGLDGVINETVQIPNYVRFIGLSAANVSHNFFIFSSKPGNFRLKL